MSVEINGDNIIKGTIQTERLDGFSALIPDMDYSIKIRLIGCWVTIPCEGKEPDYAENFLTEILSINGVKEMLTKYGATIEKE